MSAHLLLCQMSGEQFMQRARAPDVLNHATYPSLRSSTTMSDSSYETVKQPLAHDDTPPPHKSKKPHMKSPKPLPVRWQPPKSFLPCLIFHTLCFCLTFHSDLEFMWEIFKEPKGWENFHIQYLVQLNQLSTVVRLRECAIIFFSLSVLIARIGPCNCRCLHHHCPTPKTDQLRC